jgi:hypothetical protein
MILGVLGNIRDVLIIIWALLSVIAIALIIFVALTIYGGVKDLIRTVKATVNEDVKPMLAIGQDSASNVAGTTRFVSETVARPVIRGLSFLAGARRALAVFTGLTGRGKKK